MDHGFAKSACKEAQKLNFPTGLKACADAFISLQEARHKADYDPMVRFTRADTVDWVARAEAAITDLRAAPRIDRRAFAVQLLLKKRP